jgi:putative Mn2+ efflux pump MntP
MGWLSVLALACAVAMDAFAVAIVTGLTLKPMTGQHVFRMAACFGLFQALMPTIGWALVGLSVATSVDALAAGLSLSIIGAAIVVPAVAIGVVAATFTATGMVLGRRIGARWGKRVEAVGGLILIGIGVKIVMGHVLA